MSKLGIVLCAVFFTSAADVPIPPDLLNNYQHYVQNVINDTFSKIEEKSEIIMKKATKVAENLVNTKTEFESIIRNEIMLILSTVNKETNDFGLKAAVGKNITECRQLFSNLNNDAYSVSGRIQQCANAQLEMRFKLIDSINKTLSNAFANLTEIRMLSQRCGDNTSQRSHIVLSCNQLALINATWISDDIVELTPFWINNLNFLLNTFDMSLTDCKFNNGFYNFYRGARTIIGNIEICIQQIIKTEVPDVSVLSTSLETVPENLPWNHTLEPYVETSLETVQHLVHLIINDALMKVQNKTEIIQKKVEKLLNETSNFNKQFSADMEHIEILVSDEIKEIFILVSDANITNQCGQLSRRPVNDKHTVINSTQQCAIDQRDIRLKKIDNINKTLIDAVVNLMEIRKVAQYCSDNVQDIESAYIAVSCIQLAASNVTSIVENIQSPLSITEMNASVNTLQQSLGICRETNGYLNFYEVMVATISEAKNCTLRMTNEAASNKTEAILSL